VQLRENLAAILRVALRDAVVLANTQPYLQVLHREDLQHRAVAILLIVDGIESQALRRLCGIRRKWA